MVGSPLGAGIARARRPSRRRVVVCVVTAVSVFPLPLIGVGSVAGWRVLGSCLVLLCYVFGARVSSSSLPDSRQSPGRFCICRRICNIVIRLAGAAFIAARRGGAPRRQDVAADAKTASPPRVTLVPQVHHLQHAPRALKMQNPMDPRNPQANSAALMVATARWPVVFGYLLGEICARYLQRAVAVLYGPLAATAGPTLNVQKSRIL
eukprot:gene17889-biopygen5593